MVMKNKKDQGENIWGSKNDNYFSQGLVVTSLQLKNLMDYGRK